MPEELIEDKSAEESTSEDTPESTSPAGDDPASEQDPQAGDEPGDTPTAEEVGLEASQDELDELITTKYKGDRKLFAKSLHEHWKSAAELAKENRALKAKLSTQPRAPVVAEQDPTPEEHPDVPWLKQQIAAIEQRAQGSIQRQTSLVQQASKIRERIAEIRGELKHAEDSEKASLRGEISTLESQAEDLTDRWQDIEDKKHALQQEHVKLNRDIKKAEEEVKSRLAAAKRQQAGDAVDRREFLETFQSAIDDQVQQWGYPVNSKVRQHFANVVTAEAKSYLMSLPDGPDGIDPADFVAERAQAYFEILREGRTVTKKAPPAPQKRTSPSPATPPRPVVKAPSGKLTPEQAHAWVNKVLG